MKRTTVNTVADALAGLAMLSLLGTGIILRWVLPARSGRGLWLWGLDRHGWGDVHLVLAFVMTGLVCVHVALHWSWVLSVLGVGQCRGAGSSRRWRHHLATGLACLIVLATMLAGLWGLAAWQVSGTRRKSSSRPSGHIVGRGEGHRERSAEISGSMSLNEVAAETGLSLDDVRRRLGLVWDMSGSERLGQLGRRHNFTMSDARRLLGVARQGQGDPPLRGDNRRNTDGTGVPR